ncbi:MarR family winged helix-turn-helix transcriptional regulator [Pasteurella testudinis]|uniref:MarR family winged helix-turn-helix transcriptional regulator n=1 Tax=Pasteurella testudinis TaxID=761 RepID=UPI00405A1BFB
MPQRSGLQQDIDVFFRNINSINGLYHQFAKQLGVSYSTLAVLYCLYLHRPCTQKTIGDNWWLPKQTVHNVCKEMLEKQWIEVVNMPDAPRGKYLNLTAAGLAYAEPIVGQIVELERRAFDSLDENERKQLVAFTGRYVRIIEDLLAQAYSEKT